MPGEKVVERDGMRHFEYELEFVSEGSLRLIGMPPPGVLPGRNQNVIECVTHLDVPETAGETITSPQQMEMEVLGIGIDAPVINKIVPEFGNITDIRELAPAMFRLLQHTMTEERR